MQPTVQVVAARLSFGLITEDVASRGLVLFVRLASHETCRSRTLASCFGDWRSLPTKFGTVGVRIHWEGDLSGRRRQSERFQGMPFY